MDAIVLAGGKCKDDLRQTSGCEWRCDLPIRGETFLDRTLKSLPSGTRAILVGPRNHPLADAEAPPGKTFLESVKAGLAHVTSPKCLIITADMAWVSEEAVQGFLDRAGDCDLAYPIVAAEDCERRFPGLSRTTVSLAEGRFTGGNLALVSSESLRSSLTILERAYEARKSPVKLAQIVGIDLLYRLLLGRIAPKTLPIGWVEARVSRFLGAKVKAVQCPFPEIGADIDSCEQFLVMQELEKSAK